MAWSGEENTLCFGRFVLRPDVHLKTEASEVVVNEVRSDFQFSAGREGKSSIIDVEHTTDLEEGSVGK